jgi:hypothetical protein
VSAAAEFAGPRRASGAIAPAGFTPDLEATIHAGAAARDRAVAPVFPEDAFAALADAGLLAPRRLAAADELALVRAVARADSSVGRILDGHLNAAERLAVHGEPALRDRELADGRLRLGVWGADPAPGEGPPARLVGDRLRGVKTFCSGAGGLQRALVVARGPDGDGPPWAAWVDLTRAGEVEVDETWFQGAGMRASVSHRVVFHDATVLGVLGPPGSLSAQPWFARDALRTAASWAGMADRAALAALEQLAARPAAGDLEGLAAGRILAARATIDLWVAEAARAMDRGATATDAALARHAIAGAARTILDEATRACGSDPFARGGDLDRARRDLELFLNQHRLDPIVARTGLAALRAEAAAR